MIKLKNITIRNFMSIGNVSQAINFVDSKLTLVLGNNLDLGGEGARNGTGKTSFINALSYALYGAALSKIKVNNLINKTNSKGMLVTVEFEVNGTNYRIERGRSPNIFRFLVDSHDLAGTTSDEGQGEGRLTQIEIEKIFGMNHTMFKHLVALNTYNEPFLSLGANAQREIIENLLGITMLSEKASTLKDLYRVTKDKIKEEEYKIKGIEAANIQIEKSIKDLKLRQTVWDKTNKENIQSLSEQINYLNEFDIEEELEAHINLDEYNSDLTNLKQLKKDISNYNNNIIREESRIVQANIDIKSVNEKTCYACGQELHNDKHLEILAEKESIVNDSKKIVYDFKVKISILNDELSKISVWEGIPITKYKTAQEAYEHQNQLSTLTQQLNAAEVSEDPYQDQIDNLQSNGIQTVNWDEINNLHTLREHQDFLLKLLTNKDSFIRKKIIEQNLSYLNVRLNYYLTKLGLPHEVQFQSDLNVEITELGRDLDFDNLSRGERNRLILGLSWAFRDVHESMNNPIDFLAVDELMDSGLDSNGVESALGVLKKMYRERNKNIFLISHKEELLGRVNNILYVVKENGFTNFSLDKETN